MSLEYQIGEALGAIRARLDGGDRKLATICKAQLSDRQTTEKIEKRVTAVEARLRILIAGLALIASWAANFISTDGVKLIQDMIASIKP